MTLTISLLTYGYLEIDSIWGIGALGARRRLKFGVQKTLLKLNTLYYKSSWFKIVIQYEVLSKKGFLFPKQIHFWLKRLYLPARNVSPEVCKSGCEPTVNLMESQLPIGRFTNRLFQDTQNKINNLSYSYGY